MLNKNNFFYLADTWWFGMTRRCPIKVFEKLAKDRSEKGFTAIQIVIGVPPEVDVWSEDAGNSGGLPFGRDGSLNLEYFTEVDEKIDILLKYKLVPCIFGSWGPHIDILGEAALKNLWSEIIRRYHKIGVIWSVCGEADLPSATAVPTGWMSQAKNLVKCISPAAFSWLRSTYRRYTSSTNSPTDAMSARMAAWSRIGEHIARTDPSRNPITIHLHSRQRPSTVLHNPKWLTLDSIQTGHSDDARSSIRSIALDAWREHKQFINLEPWYEGILGKFDATDQRYAFWVSVLSGASGHGYGAHGVWNMGSNDGFLSHWGNSDWRSAMAAKGATNLGNAVQFLRSHKALSALTPKARLIKPEWTEGNPMLPVVAATPTMLFIYIPDVAQTPIITFDSSLKGLRDATFITPTTFQTTPTTITNQQLIIPPQQTKDVVITLKYDTIGA